jgi:hypothetical protein
MARGVDPAAVFRWEVEEPASFHAAVAAFAGLDQALGVLGNRLRYAGPREALVLRRRAVRLAWSRDALRLLRGVSPVAGTPTAPPLPTDIAGTLGTGTWEELVAEAAFHLLHTNTRPDDRVLCALATSCAFGVLTVGATLILTDAAHDELEVIAAQERAKILRPPPSAPAAP